MTVSYQASAPYHTNTMPLRPYLTTPFRPIFLLFGTQNFWFMGCFRLLGELFRTNAIHNVVKLMKLCKPMPLNIVNVVNIDEFMQNSAVKYCEC